MQPPFTQQFLGKVVSPGSEVSKTSKDDLYSLFPASRRTEEDDLVAPDFLPRYGFASVEDDPAAIHDWVDKEVDLQRLSDIHDWLWVAGRPMPPRPLHQQRLLNREIVITEKMDLHLVWKDERLLLKPLPRFLLDPWFWETFLQCPTGAIPDGNRCSCGGRRERSLGFLFSYAALVVYESDFHIAKEARLIP